MTTAQILLLTGALLGLSLVTFAVWGPKSARRWLLAASAAFTIAGLAGLAVGRNSALELIAACVWFVLAVGTCDRPPTEAERQNTRSAKRP